MTFRIALETPRICTQLLLMSVLARPHGFVAINQLFFVSLGPGNALKGVPSWSGGREHPNVLQGHRALLTIARLALSCRYRSVGVLSCSNSRLPYVFGKHVCTPKLPEIGLVLKDKMVQKQHETSPHV